MFWKTQYLFVCMLLFSSQLFAQPGPDWFKQNDRGRHFEGSYTKKVSNPSINLVSLSTAMPRYVFGNKEQLQAAFYSPSEQAYLLHAEELQVVQFYWLQDKTEKATAGWNTFSGWHVDYMLKRLSVDARNLGVLIRLGEPGSRQFAPARISMGDKPSGGARYIAQLRLGRPVAKGSFKVYLGEERNADNLIMEKPITAKSSGTVFPIVLPVETLGGASDWVRVEINLIEKRTLDPFTYSFSFYHHPKE